MSHLHDVSVGHLPAENRWDVTCSCGFEVSGLDTAEAAEDTANWHLGRPSLLGRYAEWDKTMVDLGGDMVVPLSELMDDNQ